MAEWTEPLILTEVITLHNKQKKVQVTNLVLMAIFSCSLIANLGRISILYRYHDRRLCLVLDCGICSDVQTHFCL